jgi:hypothetical protein
MMQGIFAEKANLSLTLSLFEAISLSSRKWRNTEGSRGCGL